MNDIGVFSKIYSGIGDEVAFDWLMVLHEENNALWLTFHKLDRPNKTIDSIGIRVVDALLYSSKDLIYKFP